jgi:O-antigen/teichoic acid export membrane protein
LTGNWLILMLIGALLGAADAGIFRTAVMICMLMELINTSFATMAGPHLARAAGAGDTARLRRIILVAGGIGITLAAPLGLLALLAPEWLLGLFGPEFSAGANALQWIAVGQMVNVAAGPVGVALVMQKRERPMLLIEFCATLCGLATTVVLLPVWGLAGAGLGVLVAATIRNVTNAALVWFTDAKPPKPSA